MIDKTEVSFVPDVPLTEEYLQEWYGSSKVDNIFVPTSRPKAVFTGGGSVGHEGDIMKFYIQKPNDDFTLFEYERRGERGSGMVWKSNTFKNDPEEDVFNTHIEENFEVLQQ